MESDDFYSDDYWLCVPVSRGRTACAWAESGHFVNWIGGYNSWAKDKPPEFNQWKFVRDCDELLQSTMLEF